MSKNRRLRFPDWPASAKHFAKVVHECFFSGRGTWLDERNSLVMFYDNNETLDRRQSPDPAVRLGEIRAIEKELSEADVKLLASASYPVGGPRDGFTIVMLLQSDSEVAVRELIYKAVGGLLA
jgi:hypothetical protein